MNNPNYGNMIEPEKLYPVIYTVSQSGEKIFKPQYIKGKELTEPQIKYLYDNGYFTSAIAITGEGVERALKGFIPPYRIGRAQRRAILDSEGKEVGIFKTGNEDVAVIFCEWLNAAQPKAAISEEEKYTEHYLTWRNRFFIHDVKILEYKSKSSGNRYSNEELHKNYSKAMLQSPFESKL